MTHNEAMQLALGYAWGREDASNARTYEPTGSVGCNSFATAFADGWSLFNAGKRTHMVPVRSAYDAWQMSAGKTIFRDEIAEV